MSLFFLLLPVLSGLFPQIVLLFFLLVLPFPFCLSMIQRLSFVLSFWPVHIDFLSAFPVEFPILVLISSSCFLRGSQISHKLILLLHKLVHLIQLYYSLIYKIVLALFFSFLSLLFSILFLSNCQVVNPSFIILCKFSGFTFCFCVSVCCALFGCVAFLFSEVGSSFWLGCFWLLILCVSDIV